MSETMILHHYDNSPYAEKVRLMFGLAGMRWQSLLSPPWPPRPNVDPLAGGYRRIPVAQIGADVFCDSALIAQEVARMADNPAIDPSNADESARELMQQAEGEAFFAAIASVPPVRLLGTMLKTFGPFGMVRFMKDRTALLKGGSTKPPGAANAGAILQSLFDALDARLQTAQWVAGAQPSVADLAAYHPLWLHVNCSRGPLKAGRAVQEWFERVEAIGHGTRDEIAQADAFGAARESEPRAVPDSEADAPVAVGGRVHVAPVDYGVVPVTGTLAAVTADRIIVARDTEAFGAVHVHFPRAGYSIAPA